MKKNMIFTGISAVLFVALIVMLKTYDVAAIGPQGTEIGFAALNGDHSAVLSALELYCNRSAQIALLIL